MEGIEVIKIKIGFQRQANKPIFLLKTGVIVCGNFTYQGRYKKKFKDYYFYIKSHSNKKQKGEILDVSNYRFLDAKAIYNDVAMKWQKTVSLKTLEKFVNENETFKRTEVIKREFVRAVGIKWRKVFRDLGPGNPNTPKMAWQIL